MFDQDLLDHISHELGTTIKIVQPLSEQSGVYCSKICSDSIDYVIKICGPSGKPYIKSEISSLRAIADTKTIDVPDIFLYEDIADKSFFVMEYIPTKRSSSKDEKRLGEAIAQLHLCEQAYFGWPSDNYIAGIPQCNEPNLDWSLFYIDKRIWPMIQKSLVQGLLSNEDIPSHGAFLSATGLYLRERSKPVLVHGDLWSGNYLVHEDGTPYLIDPAVYYADPLVDIAMSRLFGGFGEAFYDAYHDVHILPKNAETFEHLYQLYYLLIHLIKFGRAYRPSVISILERFMT